MDIWIYGYKDIWIYGSYMDLIWIYGSYMNILIIYGYMDIWIYGSYMDIWIIYGYMDHIWIYGLYTYISIRLQRYRYRTFFYQILIKQSYVISKNFSNLTFFLLLFLILISWVSDPGISALINVDLHNALYLLNCLSFESVRLLLTHSVL